MKLEEYTYEPRTERLVHSKDNNLFIKEGDELIIIDNHHKSQCTSHGYFGGICKSLPEKAEIITSGYDNILLNNSLSLPFIVKVPLSRRRKDYEINLVEFFRESKGKRRKTIHSEELAAEVYKVSD